MTTQTPSSLADDILSDPQIIKDTVEAIARCHCSLVGYQSASEVASHAIATEQVKPLIESMEKHDTFELRTVAEAAIIYYTMEAIAKFSENHEEAAEIFKSALESSLEEFGEL